jgi:hypothetical protein
MRQPVHHSWMLAAAVLLEFDRSLIELSRPLFTL